MTPPSATTYLVIHVRNVHHKVDIELEVVAHNAPNDISADIVAGVAQMRIIIDSRTTGIPIHLLPLGIDWNEGGLRLG